MPEPVAIVAGVGPGMGLALSRRFAREGYHIAMIARRGEALAGYAAAIEGSASGHTADLTDTADLRRALADIRAARGPARLAIYNASVWNPAPAMTIEPDVFAHDLALCCTGALVLAQAVFPDMKAAGGGTLLFTGGRLAIEPEAGTPVPSLTAGKAALRALVLAMAGELRPQGIRVGTVTINGTVAPGGRFDPACIAERFAELAALPPDDPTVEIVFDGADG